MKQFTNVNDFVNWVVAIGYWQQFQSWLYSHGHTPVDVYNNYRVGIGLWNEFNGGSGSPTDLAIIPVGVVPTARYVVDQWLKHYVQLKQDYDYYRIQKIDTKYYTMQKWNGGIELFEISVVDNSSDWTMSFEPVPVPVPDPGPGPGPGPGLGGAGGEMILVAGLILIGLSNKPRRRKNKWTRTRR